jgi:hypothetical protein
MSVYEDIKENAPYYMSEIESKYRIAKSKYPNGDDAFLKSEDEFLYMFYVYGPFVINKTFINIKDLKFNNNTDAYMYLKALSFFFNYLQRSVGYSNYKQFKACIIDLLKMIPDDGANKYNTKFREFVIDVLNNSRNYQHSNYFLESFIVDSCAIQPYMGTISKIEKSPETSNILERVVTEEDRENLKVTLLQEALDLLLKYPNFILEDCTYSNNLGTDLLLSTVPDLAGITKGLSIKDKYFLLIHTALRQDYFRKDNNKDALDKLIKLKRSNKPSDIGAVVESLVNSDLLCPSTSQLDQDRNIYSYLKNGKNNIENLERYDLDALNNYISKAHHLVANDYTNSMFTQKYPDVTGFSYMNNDIMIVEYKDIFLVCPVLDMSDNWAQKIIVLDRTGNIQLKDSLD